MGSIPGRGTKILHATLCCALSLSHVWLFVTPRTVAPWAPLSMEFSRQEHWRGFPCPPPEDLPDSGIEPVSPTLQADSLSSELPESPACYAVQQQKKKKKREREKVDTQHFLHPWNSTAPSLVSPLSFQVCLRGAATAHPAPVAAKIWVPSIYIHTRALTTMWRVDLWER